MKSGYKIFWTEHAASELEKTIQYLQTEFSDKEISKLLIKLEETLELISINPKIFPTSDKKGIHKAILLKYNSIYYREINNTVEILSFFSNRQNPKKRKL
ncbi:MAG: type II toxin-antitoxin system RelE/ParE family toxin [Cloacibacterium sp.]|uniref:type II toxin-antitoxin system RelE/ParE family toxin n=1 Tax=Cloacibacterium sp. TaxID=1913682 RepID=UPI003C707C92